MKLRTGRVLLKITYKELLLLIYILIELLRT